MTQPVNAAHYLEVPTVRWTSLIMAQAVLVICGVDFLVFGDFKDAFVTGGLGIALMVSERVSRATVLFSDDQVEVSGRDGGDMLYQHITAVEVRGRRVRLIGNKRTLEFNVRRRDLKKVLAEIEMRRGKLLGGA